MKQFNSKTKLGQVITQEEISNWQGNGNVIFDAGTGCGKTYFILNNLSQYCLGNNQKILFLCNRIALKREVEEIIERENITNVDVLTYQAIESRLNRKEEVILDYQWIACDEFHHCLEYFNPYTDLSYKYIIEHSAQKIFMSATCESLFNTYLANGFVPESQYYKIEKDYIYVEDFYFYNKKNDHELIIKDVMENSNDKIIFFTQSLKKAVHIYNQYENNATFYCSQYTSNAEAKSILKDNLHKIHDEQFEGRILIATSALDCGINLKDKEIKHIILDIYDHPILTQCLGRKRLVDESDTCTVYIRNYHKGELNTKHNNDFEPMDLFVKDKDKFYKKYGSDRTFSNRYIYYDDVKCELKLNIVAYIAIANAQKELYLMTKHKWTNRDGNTIQGIGYKRFICDKLGIGISEVKDYDNKKEEIHVNELEQYLESVVGNIMLTTKDRIELIEKLNIRDGRNNRLLKGISILNGALMENNYNYIIKEFETSRMINGKKKKYKNAWKVLRVSE